MRGVARDLDLTETALRQWVNRARADRTHGRTGLTTAEPNEQEFTLIRIGASVFGDYRSAGRNRRQSNFGQELREEDRAG